MLRLLKSFETQVIIVTSGSIQAGQDFLPNYQAQEISHLQAASSIGQPILFSKYSDALKKHNINTAQTLLTHDDFKNRTRFLNARNTLLHLLENNIIPILNENDAISFQEITVGDNDHLAVMAAQMLSVDLILFITSADGLYDRDPKENDSKIIKQIPFSYDFSQLEISSKSSSGRGGMQSKIEAVQKATNSGIECIIAGKSANPILPILTEQLGTFFEANTEKLSARKAWLLSTTRPNCKLYVDEGCKKAILANASLLPSGILRVEGEFTRGDSVSVCFEDQNLAVGLSEYSSTEIKQIKGLKTSQVSDKLGFCISDEIIHRDNLKLVNNE